MCTQLAKKVKEIAGLKSVPEKSRDHFQKVKIESEPGLLAEMEALKKVIEDGGGHV